MNRKTVKTHFDLEREVDEEPPLPFIPAGFPPELVNVLKSRDTSDCCLLTRYMPQSKKNTIVKDMIRGFVLGDASYSFIQMILDQLRKDPSVPNVPPDVLTLFGIPKKRAQRATMWNSSKPGSSAK